MSSGIHEERRTHDLEIAVSAFLKNARVEQADRHGLYNVYNIKQKIGGFHLGTDYGDQLLRKGFAVIGFDIKLDRIIVRDLVINLYRDVK